jgi:ribosome-interacting GTPase 1
VIAVARTADLVLIMLDALKGEKQKQLLEAELEAVGIRLNREKPNIYFKVLFLFFAAFPFFFFFA